MKIDEAELDLWYTAEKDKALNSYMEQPFGSPDAEKIFKERMRSLRQEYAQKFEFVLHERAHPTKSFGDKLREVIWRK